MNIRSNRAYCANISLPAISEDFDEYNLNTTTLFGSLGVDNEHVEDTEDGITDIEGKFAELDILPKANVEKELIKLSGVPTSQYLNLIFLESIKVYLRSHFAGKE